MLATPIFDEGFLEPFFVSFWTRITNKQRGKKQKAYAFSRQPWR
jgi:hypothetical protein